MEKRATVSWELMRVHRRERYDPSEAFARLRCGFETDAAWADLWDGLYDQGDVSDASCAAVPHLTEILQHTGVRDWRFYALVAAIEACRSHTRNCELTRHLRSDYVHAWEVILELAIADLPSATDACAIRAIMAAIAMGKGDRKLGALLWEIDDFELEGYISGDWP